MASPADIVAFENYPLQPPPPGQTSNFVNPESRGPAIIILCSVFISIMWPIFILRLYSKVWVIRSFGWDDASAILAAVGATAFAAGVIWCINDKAFGPHEWNVRAILLTPRLVKMQVLGSGTILNSLTMFFAKLALFLLYYRLFALNRWTKIAIHLGIILTGLLYLASSIVLIVLCIPRRDESWTSMTYVTRCDRAKVMGDVSGIIGLVSDLYIFILPLPVLSRLQMSLRKKLGITAVFLTGFIAVVASAIGLYFRVTESNNPDLTWNEPPASGLAVVEAAIGVICSSVPHLPAFFRRYPPNFSRITRLLQELRSSYWTRSQKSYEKQPYDIRNSRSKETTPQKLQVETKILGSIQGEGKFLKSGTFSKIWGNGSPTEHSTRRDYYEMTEPSHQGGELETITRGVDRLSQLPSHKEEGPVEATASEPSSRRGYGDIMTIFRSADKDTTNQSNVTSLSRTSNTPAGRIERERKANIGAEPSMLGKFPAC